MSFSLAETNKRPAEKTAVAPSKF